MMIVESRWLRGQLERIPNDELFPVLDVGSSTLEYRTEVQPWVEENIHAPLAARGGRVWHTDIKSAPGVDLAGDLFDPSFHARLAGLQARSAMVLNVLHHVPDRKAFCRAVRQLVQPGGWILVSGPHRYPRHFDPIDTLWRPDVEEVAALFPDARLVAGATLDGGNWRQWNAMERGGRSLPRMLARLCVPFYRPHKWMEAVRHTPFLVRHIRSYVLVLRVP